MLLLIIISNQSKYPMKLPENNSVRYLILVSKSMM